VCCRYYDICWQLFAGCIVWNEKEQGGRQRLDKSYSSSAYVCRARDDKHQQAGKHQRGDQLAEAAYDKGRAIVQQPHDKQANGNISECLSIAMLTHARPAMKYTPGLGYVAVLSKLLHVELVRSWNNRTSFRPTES
jgi:hypothetical protein